MTGFRCLLALVVFAALVLAGAGCASTAERESDLPWNMTQPWESAPSIPFGSTGAY